VLSVLAIVPLAALLSHATESVAAKTGDRSVACSTARCGNLTELVIALAALRAGEYTLVKASIAGAIVTNTLFMLGASFPARRTQVPRAGIQPGSAACRRACSFLPRSRCLIPSAVSRADSATGLAFTAS
jgi:Ca2+:H+ antiporter